jgi:excisionase family DNA binding protein
MTPTELVADGAVGLDEASRLSGLQRSKLYELMGEGELAFVKVGARRLIPRRAIVALLAKNVVGGSSLIHDSVGDPKATRAKVAVGR